MHELNSLQGDFIKFPITRQDSLKKIEGFSQISKIPNVVAAIDGTHTPIKAPLNNHEDYFNRKHFYSYVMQAVVDSHGLYLSVSTGYPGSLHDARVLRLSEIFEIIAACVLHNICTLRGENYDVSDDSDDSESEDDEDPTPGANATLQAVVDYVADL